MLLKSEDKEYVLKSHKSLYYILCSLWGKLALWIRTK